MERPPSPGDDATPFLLKCYAKAAPFRPIADFEPQYRSQNDEYKIYVWKTTTLREVAEILHEANPALSEPLSLHAFRVVFFDSNRRVYDARQSGAGITRVPLSDVEELMRDKIDTVTGWARLKEEVDEDAANTSLAKLQLEDGDILDCIIRPDPIAIRNATSLRVGEARSKGQERSSYRSQDRHRGPMPP